MKCLRSLALPLTLLTLIAVGGCTPEGDSDDDVVGDAGDSTDDAGTETDAADTSTDDAVDTSTDDAVDTSTDDAVDASTDDATDTTDGTCSAFGDATPQVIIAAATAGEAATAPVVPDSQTVYQVTLPEGAAGFIELQIAEWETTQVFYTVETIDYVVTVETNSQVPEAREPDATCPDAGITRQAIFFPHWTPALIEFSATGPREIPLMIVQQ